MVRPVGSEQLRACQIMDVKFWFGISMADRKNMAPVLEITTNPTFCHFISF